MFFRLSAHSPRESGWRRMCCSSWQILHLFSVSVAPGPEIRRSPCAHAAAETSRPARQTSSRIGKHADPVPAVPEVAERVPGRHRRLRIAALVPGAREERRVAGLLRLEDVAESAPGVLVAGTREVGTLPGLAFVARDLDAVHRTLAHPGA